MGITRRRFIGQSIGWGAALGAGLPILQSCGGDDDTASPTTSGGGSSGGGSSGGAATTAPGTTLPDPTASGRAVTTAIADGLPPEAGPLRVFNYADYVNPDTVASFEEKYGVKVEITTFDVDAEAIAKLASGAVDVDLHHSAAPNSLDRIIAGGLIQPLNKTYLTNLGNILPAFADPWYDPGARYTVPYTVFSSGIGYRTDRVDAADVEAGWDVIWNETYKGVTSILDDYREGLALALLRKGITDVNTTDRALISQAGDDLRELIGLMNIKVNIEGYKDLPEGATDLAHTWNGDLLAGAYSYLPEGTDASVLGWWYPADGIGVVNNDCMAVIAGAKNPVLAHLYINHLIDAANAEENFTWNGYQPPIVGLDADYLIGAEYVPENLRNAVLTDEVIANGLRYKPLDLDTDAAWQEAWSRFTAG